MLALLNRRHAALLLGGALLALVLTAFVLRDESSLSGTSVQGIFSGIGNIGHKDDSDDEPEIRPSTQLLSDEELRESMANIAIEHLELKSNMTANGNYFDLDFDGIGSYNPNIIPHPYKPETFIIVAQRDKQDDDNRYWYTEIVCEAQFQDSTLRCVNAPMNLPIASTTSPVCDGRLESFNNYIGPHDARVFYGPHVPYIIFGSQSLKSCLGQWMQDLRRVVDWGLLIEESVSPPDQPFFHPVELQRPGSYLDLEKNWFPFWDVHGKMYLHFDMSPGGRVFAEVDTNYDGTVGENIAHLAATDASCMEKHLPKIRQNDHEWMHQATNSLQITFCNRADTACQSRPHNVFIFSILHHKTFYSHGVYEPYTYLFSAEAPFALHAIASKPFWIPGRGEPYGYWSSKAAALANPRKNKSWVPKHQSQMLFVVSISWKERGQQYHGYLDDEVFVSFGIEDQGSGGIAVRAADLLGGLNMCDD